MPTILPGILTAWKVNLGNAARVVVVAELVGATGGVINVITRRGSSMSAEVIEWLAPGRGGVFVDCTVGCGGHAAALLDAGAERVIGIEEVLEAISAPGLSIV